MQYNEDVYNSSAYNVGVLVLTLFESLASTDSDINDPSILKTELLTIVDVLQKFFGGQILTETITMSDVQLKTYFAGKLDIMSLTDARVATIGKVLLESMSATDLRTVFMETTKNEFILLVDSLSKFISNKRVDETLRLHDWLSVKKNPAGNIWSN